MIFIFLFSFFSSYCFASHLDCSNLPFGFYKISDNPEIYEAPLFLTSDDCQAIIALAYPYLVRSTVVDAFSHKSVLDDRRTSFGTFLSKNSTDPVLSKIYKQTEELTNIPQSHGEGLQVLLYKEGGQYLPHFDFFDVTTQGGFFHYNRGGQRIVTLLIYLNTPEKGGETVFPYADVKIMPIEGKAVLFYNVDEFGIENFLTLHGGAPVLAGEKWIATLWLRENIFR